MPDKQDIYYYGLGRRKEAVASVRLYKGDGGMEVNGRTAEVYFNNDTFISLIRQPLVLAGQDKNLKATVRVNGGGKSGQADAIRLGVARALQVMAEDLRPTLKKAGLLTRDPREKERKKYGLKRARKAPQFSKR
jgi:small subunit ribosomal protein S9